MTEETGGHVIAWDINKAAIAEVAEDLKDIDAYVDLPAAKAAKKTLTKMRTALGEAHKETKAEALAFGRKVDAKKNEYLVLIREIEDPITADLDKIKNAEAVAEEERVGEILEHITRLQAYALDRHSLTLEEMKARRETLQSEVIDPEMYQEMAEDAQLSKDEADLKLRLAIDRETTRLEEEADKARIEAENQELRDKLAKAEAEEHERNREAVEEAARKSLLHEKEVAERQEELDAQQAEIDRQNKEREDEQTALANETYRKAQEDEAEKLAALQAPDVVKLETYAEAIHHLVGLRPVMGSTAGNQAVIETVAHLDDAHDTINAYIEDLK